MVAPALVPVVILAAGGSARMGGRDKLLEPVRGSTILRDRAVAALTTGAPVFVTLPARGAAPERWAALAGLEVMRVPVTRAAEGLAASLRAGLGALPAQAAGAAILPADMPDITGDDIARLMVLFDGERPLRGASSAGVAGHPVLIPRRLFHEVMRIDGDQGAREILKRANDLRLIPLPGANAVTDLDTPEDWADWRARQESPT